MRIKLGALGLLGVLGVAQAQVSLETSCFPPDEFIKITRTLSVDLSQVQNKSSCPTSQIMELGHSRDWALIQNTPRLRSVMREANRFPDIMKGPFDQYVEELEMLDYYFNFSQGDESNQCFSDPDRTEIAQTFKNHEKVLLEIFPAAFDAVYSSETLDLEPEYLSTVQKLRLELSDRNIYACYDEQITRNLGVDLQAEFDRVQNKLGELEGFRVDRKQERVWPNKDRVSAQIPPHPVVANRNEGLFRSFQRFIGGLRDFFVSDETRYVEAEGGTDISLVEQRRSGGDLGFGSTQGGSRYTDFLKAKGDEAQFRRLALESNREANYWLEVMRDVSGVRADLIDKKMEHTSEVLKGINQEMQQSLDAIGIICESQATTVKCTR